jgi:hypothetical protein
MHITEVVEYVKGMLTGYAIDLEIDDQQIQNIIKNSVISILNQYVPQVKIRTIPRTNFDNTTWTVELPEQQVVNILHVSTKPFPLYPLTLANQQSLITAQEFVLNRIIDSYSYTYDVRFSFIPPNKLQLYNEPMSDIVVMYSCSYKDDLSDVPNSLEYLVKALALANVKIAIGNIRTKYQSFDTPFGSITLAYDIKQEGMDELRTIIEELKASPPPIPVMVV